MFDFFVLMLAIPLVSGALLTVFGERAWAPNLNIIASLGTFLAAVGLTVEIVANGSRFAFGEQFFIDSLSSKSSRAACFLISLFFSGSSFSRLVVHPASSEES